MKQIYLTNAMVLGEKIVLKISWSPPETLNLNL